MKTDEDLRPARCPTCAGPTFHYVVEQQSDLGTTLAGVVAAELVKWYGDGPWDAAQVSACVEMAWEHLR